MFALKTLVVALIAVMAVNATRDADSTTSGSASTSSSMSVERVTVTIPDSLLPTFTTIDGTATTVNFPAALPTKCSGRDMPNDNFASINAAKDVLAEDCKDNNTIIRPQTGLIWKSAKAQVYYCNYGTEEIEYDLFCNRMGYDEASKEIDGDCGKGGGGWVFWAVVWQRPFSIGRDPRYDENGREVQECGWNFNSMM